MGEKKKRRLLHCNRVFSGEGLMILMNHWQTTTRIHYLVRQKPLFLVSKLSVGLDNLDCIAQ